MKSKSGVGVLLVLALQAFSVAAQEFDGDFIDASIPTGSWDGRLADVDGDGLLDYVVAVNFPGGLMLARGVAPDVFEPLTQQDVGVLNGEWTLADLDGDGAAELLFLHSAPGGPTKLLDSFRFVEGQFVPIESRDVEGEARGLVATHVNDDAFADVLVVHPPTGRIHVYHGAADGTLHFAGDILSAPGASPLALGDVDGNGLTDIVLAVTDPDGPAKTLVALRQISRESYVAEGLGFAVPNGHALAVGDLDGDGLDDVLVSDSGTITTFLGQANGLPRQTGEPFITEDGSWSRFRTVDLDDDGSVEVLRGINFPVLYDWRDGLQPILRSTVSSNFAGLRVFGDVDQDGFTDVLSGTFDPLQIYHGTGTLSWRELAPLVADTARIEVADIDGDGRLDLAGASPVGVFTAAAGFDGAFGQATLLAGVEGTFVVDVSDMNGDGHVDVVTSSSPAPAFELFTAFGDGAGDFAPATATLLASIPEGDIVTVGDVTGDQIVDLIVQPASPNDELRVVAGNAAGGFSEVSSYTLPSSGSVAPEVLFASIRDVDLDGFGDLIFFVDDGQDLHEVRVLRGAATGILAESSVVATSPSTRLAVGDATNDGILDLIVAEGVPAWGPDPVVIHTGVGDGSFGTPDPVDGVSLCFLQSLVVADVDVDGLADLVLNCRTGSGGFLNVFYGQAGGGFAQGQASVFAASTFYEPGIKPTLRVVDLDGDARPEVVLETRADALAIFSPTDAVWSQVGASLSGPAGFSALRGDGSLTTGSSVTLEIPNGPPSATYGLVLGADVLEAPLFGGVLYPTPDAIVFGTTDAAGRALLSFPWPKVPAGFDLYVQAWFPGEPASTIAIRGVTPAD